MIERERDEITSDIRNTAARLGYDPPAKLPRDLAALKEMRRKLHAEAHAAGLRQICLGGQNDGG